LNRHIKNLYLARCEAFNIDFRTDVDSIKIRNPDKVFFHFFPTPSSMKITECLVCLYSDNEKLYNGQMLAPPPELIAHLLSAHDVPALTRFICNQNGKAAAIAYRESVVRRAVKGLRDCKDEAGYLAFMARMPVFDINVIPAGYHENMDVRRFRDLTVRAQNAVASLVREWCALAQTCDVFGMTLLILMPRTKTKPPVSW
jgi:hypothetical protein